MDINTLLRNINEQGHNKVKIIDTILKVLSKESASLVHCSEVISRVCLELPRCPIEDVVRWSNHCVQSIVEDSDINMLWRDFLPECLSTLESHDTIKHCDTDMTPLEFQQLCVSTLCQCRWKDRQLVQLTAMFKDMQLTQSDHNKVVNKICMCMSDVSPETLPPLVHQLLRLCKFHNIEVVLAYLIQYFNMTLYSKMEGPRQDSDSTTMDIDEIAPHCSEDWSRCLSTCLYHFCQGAAEPDLIRKQLKQWPRSQVLRSPFLMDLALAMSDKGRDFRTDCIDMVRSAIEQSVLDDIRSQESGWVRAVIPPGVDVVSLLKILTSESSYHLQLTVVGLINLAFSLLSLSRQKQVAPTCWSYGKLLLVRLCKVQPETAGHILRQLGDRLAGDLAQKQYADCLYVLCKLTPLPVERCPHLLTTLESCLPSATDYRTAAALLDAVHPLLNFSTRIRDTLIMVCRKGLYSRAPLHRCLALSGFLSVLRHIRLSSASTSQSDQLSAQSYLTQLSYDLHATLAGAPMVSRVRNEAMCLEVVSILRRCLVLDASVKQLLYCNIYDCLSQKTSLHEPLLEILREHLHKYRSDDNTGPLVLWDKCIRINDTIATLSEPIGYLLYAIAQFVQESDDEDMEDVLGGMSVVTGYAYRNQLVFYLDKLVDSDLLPSAELDRGPGVCDLTPESRAKCLKLQQMLQCYDALIAHQIMQCRPTTDNFSSSLFKLYKAHTQIIDNAKTPSKITKKGSKTMNDTNESSKSQKSQKDDGKATKMSGLVKDRVGPFKPLPCLWNLNLCARVVELLYSESVPWCSSEQRNLVRTRRELHTFILRNIHSVINSEDLHKRHILTDGLKIANILYERCIARFQDLCDFDEQTALLCVEVFKDCVNLIMSQSYGVKAARYLPQITGLTEASPSECVAAILECVLGGLEGSEGDAGSRRLDNALSLLAVYVLDIPQQTTTERYTNVIRDLMRHVRSSNRDTLLSAMLTAECSQQQTAPFLEELLIKLSSTLGRIASEEEEEEETRQHMDVFPSIDERSGQSTLVQVCGHLAGRVQHITLLLIRARDYRDTTDTGNNGILNQLLQLNKSLVVQLCQLSSWTAAVSRLRCTVGQGSARVLQALTRLYGLLGKFIKHLIASVPIGDPTLLHSIRVERLVKLTGESLTVIVHDLITYVCGCDLRDQTANTVLRDTRTIPLLVAESETYNMTVVLLSKRTKLDYEKYLSLGIARDFDIKLKRVLNVVEQDNRADGVMAVDDVDSVLVGASDDSSNISSVND